MNNKTDIYTIVGWLSLITMPLAAGVSFGWNAYVAMLGNGVLPFFAVLGGGSFAVGLELFGIAAGHLAIKAFQRQQWVYLGLTVLAVSTYVAVGTYEMRDIAFARFVPVLAVAVYVIVGIESVMKETDEAVAIQSAAANDADRQEREAAAQRQHELDMRRVDAQLEAKKSADAAAAKAKAEVDIVLARERTEQARIRAEVRAAKQAASTAPTTASTVPTVRYAEEAKQLHQLMNGEAFGRRDVEANLTVGRTKATEILKTGLNLGLWKSAGNDKFVAIHD